MPQAGLSVLIEALSIVTICPEAIIASVFEAGTTPPTQVEVADQFPDCADVITDGGQTTAPLTNAAE